MDSSPRPATSKQQLPHPALTPWRDALAGLRGADLLSLASLSRTQVLALLELAAAVKGDIAPFSTVMQGKSGVLLFEKPSLRTRMSFEVGVHKLGGHAIYMDHSAQRLGERESVTDYGKNLERWVDLIVARVFRNSVIVELAAAARVPVVNALCDLYHPCQALADFFTLFERSGRTGEDLRRVKLAYVGDGNNVAHSLMHGAAILGVELVVITPEGHAPEADIVAESRLLAAKNASPEPRVSASPDDVKGAAAVYTDVWVSMGESAHSASERRKFNKYQVNEALMAKAGPDAVFMHCLPAKRGQEVTDGVMDSPLNVAYDQAENRMHAQNALLSAIFGV
ncbi:MAG: ornithine carbamoyltransferase [Planctomycetota bacterium]|nr:ornithine carbamoyltransferase [Planctomycetota bacterium]